MPPSLNRYRVDLRDFRFVLFEQFKLDALLGKGPFADWGEEEIHSVLSEAQRYALEVAGPLNATGDQQGCKIVAGNVKVPEGFKEAYERLYESGFKSLTLAEEDGGANAPKSLAVLVNELTSGPNASLDMYGGLTLGAAELIHAFGTSEQKERFCEKMFTGVWAGTMCLTEPQAGSDVGLSTAVAKKNADGTYNIRGAKIFISGGDQDITENIIHMVLARVEGAPLGTRGLSLFIVPKTRADGSNNDVRVASIEHKMGLNGSATCVLSFGEEGCCVGELTGSEENQGIRQMFQMMNFARIGVGVQGLGCASTAYLNALEYARERTQGAHVDQARDPEAERIAIIEHPDIRRSLLEMKAKVEGIRAMIVKAAHHVDCAALSKDSKEQAYHLGQTELLTPLIKSYASDQAFQIAQQAIQIYGGAGYTKDYPVEQYCRDAKVFAIYEGTNHIQALDLVGRKLRQDGGQHAMAFLQDIKTFVHKYQGHAQLSVSLACLSQAAEAAASVAAAFASWAGQGQLRRVPLVANQFLEMLSEVCVAWMLLDAAIVAGSALENLAEDHPDRLFYQGKQAAARYFCQWVLPRHEKLAEIIRDAPADALELDNGAFATV